MLVVIGGRCQPFVLHIQGPRDVDVGFGCSRVFVINFLFIFVIFRGFLSVLTWNIYLLFCLFY